MKSLLFFILLLGGTSLFAQQPGTLDASFANGGTLVQPLPGNRVDPSVAVTGDGRILVGTFGPYNGFASAFRVDALLPDGTPDASFGENGSAFVLFPGMTSPADRAAVTSLALLPDGKILAGGSLQASGNPNGIAFARLLPNGTPDSSFGISGTATASFGYEYEGAGNILVQPDGKILCAGSVSIYTNKGYYNYFSISRFLPDGTKDTSFGNEGIVVSTADGYANAVAIHNDGRIVAAGYRGSTFVGANFHIERYNRDGSYDKSFGVNGVVDEKINNSSVCFINGLAVQQDEKLVVAGTSNGPFDYRFTIVRYNVDGNKDAGFGKDGIIANTFTRYSEGSKIFIAGEKRNKIIATGSTSPDGEGYDFAVVGYNADGSIDTEFGNEGIQTTDFGGTDAVTSTAIQSDGKIVLLGYTQVVAFPSPTYRALARYYGYPQQVPLFVRIRRWLQNHGITWKGLPAEHKIAYYTVEQSANGRSGFSPVAKVSGAANLKDYSITNSHLLQGNNYYRIKAVSTDGVVRYSEVVSADNTANTASVFPNPAKSYVTVQGLPNNETANISIKDGSGTVLARGVSKGSTQYRTALGKNMQPGTYYLNITTGSKTETLKFVKE